MDRATKAHRCYSIYRRGVRSKWNNAPALQDLDYSILTYASLVWLISMDDILISQRRC